MIDKGKFPLLGIRISAVDYESAVNKICKAAHEGVAYGISALAVHGIMTGRLDVVHQRRLNGLDLIVPDGQPVRWGLKWLHNIKLPDRVYGPDLTLKVAKKASEERLPIYLYGSNKETLNAFSKNLIKKFPELIICGQEPSKFKKITQEEKNDVIARIKDSGAKIVFVGLGCPRQEVWVYEYKEHLSMPLLAVGAAFDFHAGTLKQAPTWMQNKGLEWFYRLMQEPKRLWKRYLYLNPLYLLLLFGEILNIKRKEINEPTGNEKIESFG